VGCQGGGALDVFHNQIRLVILFAGIEDTDDVRMVEHPRRMGFVEEHFARDTGGFVVNVRTQPAHFDGHVPVVERVVADVDDAHVSAPRGADDRIFSDFFW